MLRKFRSLSPVLKLHLFVILPLALFVAFGSWQQSAHEARDQAACKTRIIGKHGHFADSLTRKCGVFFPGSKSQGSAVLETSCRNILLEPEFGLIRHCWLLSNQ